MNNKDDEIIYSTIDEQIAKLRQQHLIIDDEDFARYNLELYGYFNLIKGYRDPYVIKNGESITYRDGVTFEQITSLYILDKNLRNSVIAAMLDLEEHIKAVTAEVVSSSFGTHQDDYLDFRNYRDKKKRKYRFSLSGILKTMRNSLNTDKNPVFHYRNAHGIVPPWVLFKNIFFSTIVNYIDLLKSAEQTKLLNHLYNENRKISDSNMKKIMKDTLSICLEYRNLAAHGARIYNHVCTSMLRIESFEEDNFHGEELQGFNQLIFLLSLLKYKNPCYTLQSTLDSEVNRHCGNFPEDVTYLGQILNVNIESHNIVWISNNSKIFHLDDRCSGIKNPEWIELEDAINKGYEPCKKCFQNFNEDE